MSADPRARESVRRVQRALEAAGATGKVIALHETARSAEDAARALGCPLGAIVKSLVFRIGDRPVMALIAGDRRCQAARLTDLLGIDGTVARADADFVRESTGFSIGGVAPLGLSRRLAAVQDRSLRRFDVIYAAAGHPHCVFPTTAAELTRLTGAVESGDIAV